MIQNTGCVRVIGGRFLKSMETRSSFIVSYIAEKHIDKVMSIHAQIIEKEGKKEFAVLPYDEFLLLQEALEDYEDLKTLRAEKSEADSEPTRSLDDVLREVEN